MNVPMRVRQMPGSVPHRRRGFTVVEILVAALLSTGLALVVAASLNSAARTSATTVRKALAEQQARDLADLTVRYLRAAVPLSRCVVGSTQACVLAEPDGSAFLTANESRVEFYAFTADTPGLTVDGRPLAPDKVTIAVVSSSGGTPASCTQGCLLQVSVQRAASAHVDPVWVPATLTAEVRRSVPIGTTSAVPAPFRFLTIDGTAVCSSGCTSANVSELRSVAVILFDPQLTVVVDGQLRIVGVPRVVALPSTDPGGR